MHGRNLLVIAATAIAALLLSTPAAHSADSETHKQDEQAIRAAAKQYVEALARGDAKTMHALWLPDGDVVDEFGRVTLARDVIDQEAKPRQAIPADDEAGSRIHLIDSSIRFLTSDVAIEDGRVEVAPADKGQPPPRGRFAAIWVKNDGQWRLANLRETRMPETTSDDLAGLDGMVGQWTGQVDKARFDISTRWNEKHTFLERDLTVTHEGKVVLSGAQRIGIDPLDGQIKSWMHDSDGGHGEGDWTKHGDAWVVHATGVSPDGRRTVGTNVYTFDGKNQITWKSTGAFADGRPMPDFEITLERTASGEN